MSISVDACASTSADGFIWLTSGSTIAIAELPNSENASAATNSGSAAREARVPGGVVGGAEAAIHPMPIAAFAAMQALSTRNDEPERASRPYDKDRDGFVLGEGAALLVLESEEHATARGARIYGELAGAGISADAHDMVQPNPTGETQARAMTMALREAGLQPGDVVHVNAHATSTPQGDLT